VLVTLTDDNGARGRGESYGLNYEGETPASIVAQIESVRQHISAGVIREELLQLLPFGGARCALDFALWDLEAKQTGVPAWRRAGLSAWQPLTSAFTIGLRSRAALEATVARCADYPVLKIKVNADAPMDTLRAVRKLAPCPRLIVDPNQSWTMAQLREYAPACKELGVVLLEQPLAVDSDSGLLGYTSPVPLCADELIHTRADLPKAMGKYQMINIKLDKAGGLTEALHLARAARAAGFELMVGCMWGSSLAMAPAMIVGQLCSIVDLDGPLLQKTDWPDAIHYELGRMSLPKATLWG
jgi:L-alanine-DL-glutamate epimerase-like enolase superfamily enzyme